MILVDTNIIIDFWNGNKPEYENVFNNNEVAICDVVKVELLRGAQSEKEYNNIQDALSGFMLYRNTSEDWSDIARELFTYARKGLRVPMQDAIIAHTGIKYNLPIWTNDKHFHSMAKIDPKIHLYAM